MTQITNLWTRNAILKLMDLSDILLQVDGPLVHFTQESIYIGNRFPLDNQVGNRFPLDNQVSDT